MSDQRGTAKTGWIRKSNRKLIALATGIAIAIGGVFGVQALANSQTYAHMKLYAGYQGGGHGGHHKGLSDLSDEELEARIERMVKHVAIEIDATEEQQDRITALVTAAAKDPPGRKYMICSWRTRSTGPRSKSCARSALRRPR